MTTLPNGRRIFVNDFVSVSGYCGKLKKLLVEVKKFILLLTCSYTLATLQKSSNKLLMEIQPITSHSFNSGEPYYFVCDNTITVPIDMVDQVHAAPPFPRENIRVSIEGSSGITRLMTDDVRIGNVEIVFICLNFLDAGVGEVQEGESMERNIR